VHENYIRLYHFVYASGESVFLLLHRVIVVPRHYGDLKQGDPVNLPSYLLLK